MNEERQQQQIELYKSKRPVYGKLSTCVKNILHHAIPPQVSIHSIEPRAKTVDSFRKKCLKLNDEGDDYKYLNPLSEVTDLAGVRVIAFFPKALPDICSAIECNFTVKEKKDIGEERFDQGKIGYKSIHYLIELPSNRTELAEYQELKGYTAEIQVRTILQHAWAEMEHDIQYKSNVQIPRSIRKRFAALAGMLEIADREFQAIQDEDEKIRSVLKASLEIELSEQSSNRESKDSGKKSDSNSENEARSVRALMMSGDYREAISHYTKLIEYAPESHTLYMGRAKAYFLAGLRSNAIEDLRYAISLNSNDPKIFNLLSKIEDGVMVSPSFVKDAWQLVSQANVFLTKGDAEKAFGLYSEAQAIGFTSHFSAFNKAMACVLRKDCDGANYYINLVVPHNNSPMEVNVLALKAIISAVSGSGYAKNLKALEKKLEVLQGFEKGQSPLRHLEEGFRIRDTRVEPKIETVFKVLGS